MDYEWAHPRLSSPEIVQVDIGVVTVCDAGFRPVLGLSGGPSIFA